MLDLVAGLLVLIAAPVLVIWWIPYLVHEIGHALGAVLAGATFEYVPLGPFALTRASGLRWRPIRYSCAATLPSETHPRRQLFIATVAGPLLSIVVGIAAFVAGLSDGAGRAWYLAPLALLLLGTFTGMHGVAQLIPARPYGSPSDGRRVLSLLEPSASGRRWVSLRRIAASADAGVRPREWSADLIEPLTTANDGSIDDVAGALTLYWHLLDGGHIAQARDCLERARVSAGHWYMRQNDARLVLLELAYVEARIGADPSIAIEHLTSSAFFARASLARVLAAIGLSYAELDRAEAIALAGLKDMSGTRPGFAEMERDLLMDLVEEARQRRAGTPRSDIPAPERPIQIDLGAYAAQTASIRVAPAPSMRAAKIAVGLAGTIAIALAAYMSVALFSVAVATPVAVAAAIIGSAIVLGTPRIDAPRIRAVLRSVLEALATFTFASPVLLNGLFRSNALGYVWISGQIRPCAAFGTGHDLYYLPFYVFLLFPGIAGPLIALHVPREPIVSRPGIVLGIALVVLWLATVGSDRAPLAALMGCG